MSNASTAENPSALPTSQLQINIGPQHPSTHGVFRMNVTLDGETVVKLKPVMGYLHRNHEQLAEDMSWLGSMPYTDRLDYFCSMTNNLAYAQAVEKMLGLEVPEVRADGEVVHEAVVAGLGVDPVVGPFEQA